MACPDRNTDAAIVAAIEKRKAQETPVQQYQQMIWAGDLATYLMVHGESQIVMIEKIGENWMILNKK